MKSKEHESLKNEISALKKLKSPGIVKVLHTEIIKVNKTTKHFAIVTEKMDGSLKDIIKEKKKLT